MPSDLFSEVPLGHAEHAVQIVESVLEARGVPLAEARQPNGPKRERRYALQRGSAVTLIQVTPPGSALSLHDVGRVRIVAPVVSLPADERRAELFQHLLEENATLTGAAFAITAREVILVAERSVQDLDESEVEHMIDTISAAADRYDDLLAERYGVARAADGGPPG
jgi:hypothetical protein